MVDYFNGSYNARSYAFQLRFFIMCSLACTHTQIHFFSFINSARFTTLFMRAKAFSDSATL